MIDVASRHRLLELAHAAITAQVRGQPPSPPPLEGPLGEAGAAFVTIHCGGALRGCIGHLDADEALAQVVARMAVAACSADPRFRRVQERELAGLAVEISVIGAFESIAGPLDIRVGRDGLLVEQGRRRGLLLPQVAVEHGWDAETFLSQTCVKAGLATNAWRTGAALWRFEAEVFGDETRDP
jgi:uncharacterized protein